MPVTEVEAKSILRRQPKIESWFLSRYGMNLYRGCRHDCVYCDGQGWPSAGVFGEDVAVKVNAIEVLRRELDPSRRRKPLKKGFILLGGGVGDSYQPIEEKYRLARRALELLEGFDFPVHVLTKSAIVLRDAGVLKRINSRARTLVSFSLSSADDALSRELEPLASLPSERLAALASLDKEGLAGGVYLMPIVPFVTDAPELLEQSVRKSKEAGAKFIVYGGMTVKEGRQKDHLYRVLGEKRPELPARYDDIYRGARWGEADPAASAALDRAVQAVLKRHGVPCRMPPAVYGRWIGDDDRVIVVLEHIDYLLKSSGGRSSYGYAAYCLSKLDAPLEDWKGRLRGIKGVSAPAAAAAEEVLETGRCALYEKLMEYGA